MTTIPACPACSGPKPIREHLCPGCRATLPTTARKRIGLRDARSALRLAELLDQLQAGVPLHEIQIATR